MGWINCDRFMGGDVRLTTYKVQTDSDANVRLMVKNYRSFFVNEFTASQDKGHKANKRVFVFLQNTRQQGSATYMHKKINGVIYLAIEQTRISAEPFTISDYKRVTWEELETTIKELPI